MKFSKEIINGVEILTIENQQLKVQLAPALGGKLTGIYNKQLEKEFLWHNEGLQLAEHSAGADYDDNFWGGIDELLPNDIPENIDGLDYPDHGELWTSSLAYDIKENQLVVYGRLKQSGLVYSKTLSLLDSVPEIRLDYRIINQSGENRHFLWKLHAALRVSPEDYLLSSARKARVVYPEASRFSSLEEFSWPMIEGVDASIVPPKSGSMDFFYLYDGLDGEMGLVLDQGKHLFAYRYDQAVFPYQWYFASYGKFRDHYTAILEPASAMPVSVNEAMEKKQCSSLEPNQELVTSVTIYAGKNGFKQ